MDIPNEILIGELIPLATFTASALTPASIDTQGLIGGNDQLSLKIKAAAVAGSGTDTFQLQDSADNVTFANVATTSLMPATSVAVAANGSTILPIQAAAIRRYLRLTQTIAGITSITTYAELLYRSLQTGTLGVWTF